MKGLVLIGGKSVRMGVPKHELVHRGKSQVQHASDLLLEFCDKVWISGRNEQAESVKHLPFLPDAFGDIGAMGGLLTAFAQHPNSTWCIVGCDFPYLNSEAIQELVLQHDSSHFATAFEQEGILQPLVAIYEPICSPFLQNEYEKGNYSLRIFLENNNTKRLQPANALWLKNVNTPEAWKAFLHETER